MNSKGDTSVGDLGLAGGIVAVVLSWIVNKSIIWAIVHFFCSWIYIIYWILVKTSMYSYLEGVVRQ